MGVTIEVHRSRIGSHHNFTQCRDIVDPTYTVHADFNQGSESMFGMNAGKQCVAMSLYAIVYKEIKSVNIWDGLMLNSILMCGNSLYGIISQSINKSYLLLTDVPEFRHRQPCF